MIKISPFNTKLKHKSGAFFKVQTELNYRKNYQIKKSNLFFADIMQIDGPYHQISFIINYFSSELKMKIWKIFIRYKFTATTLSSAFSLRTVHRPNTRKMLIWGHLVTRNFKSDGEQLPQRPKNPMKRHITCPKMRFGKKGHWAACVSPTFLV